MRTVVGRVRIQLAPDGSTAEAHVARGAAMPRGELETLLAEAGVVYGLDAAAIDGLAARLVDETFSGRTIVARGQPPRPGRDGRIDAVCQVGPTPGRVRPGGSIDFHERSLLCSAAAGDVIAKVVPPEQGQPGTDVRGRAMPPPTPKVVVPRLGPGARLESGSIIAAVDGVVRHTGEAVIDVLPLWKHDGDVDLHSGNLRIKGTLIVRGDVREGFAVAATGDVLVQGTVQDGRVEAGGNVVVGQSIQGHSDVQAGGDVSCHHATAATLHASGTVRIHDQAAHCRIKGATVELLRGRGHVVGGEVRARQGIRVLEAGTEGGAVTRLVVADLSDEQVELVREEVEANRAARASRKVVLAGAGERGKGGQLGRGEVAATDQALARRLELADAQRELLRTACVSIRDRVHAGVCIRFGHVDLEVGETSAGVTYRWNEESSAILEEKP